MKFSRYKIFRLLFFSECAFNSTVIDYNNFVCQLLTSIAHLPDWHKLFIWSCGSKYKENFDLRKTFCKSHPCLSIGLSTIHTGRRTLDQDQHFGIGQIQAIEIWNDYQLHAKLIFSRCFELYCTSERFFYSFSLSPQLPTFRLLPVSMVFS